VQPLSATKTVVRSVTERAAAEFIRRHGGKLYVWPAHHRCCGGLLTLLSASATAPPPGKSFHSLQGDGFEVYLDRSFREMPSELHIKLKGVRRKHIDVFWNVCAFVV
jgi:hypothetical protein